MPQYQLTESEWRIMLFLWEEPHTMPQLLDLLHEETGWSRHSLICFLNRLLEKGAISVEMGRPRLYRAVWPKAESVREETESFLRRVYRGDAGLMVSSLVEQEALTREDVEELMRLLDTRRADGD